MFRGNFQTYKEYMIDPKWRAKAQINAISEIFRRALIYRRYNAFAIATICLFYSLNHMHLCNLSSSEICLGNESIYKTNRVYVNLHTTGEWDTYIMCDVFMTNSQNCHNWPRTDHS